WGVEDGGDGDTSHVSLRWILATYEDMKRSNICDCWRAWVTDAGTVEYWWSTTVNNNNNNLDKCGCGDLYAQASGSFIIDLTNNFQLDFIATGCEDGTVRYSSGGDNWSASKLLGQRVGSSAVRSLCTVQK
ncbi:hypothetical protein M8C21_017508, partial [Ambrosia artemisiifolia]